MTYMHPITRAWRSLELRIAFFKTPQNKTRKHPSLWAPKDAKAALLDRPEDQEALMFIKSDDPGGDVEMCFRPDHIIAKRDDPKGWSAVDIQDEQVSIKAGDVVYVIKSDGSLVRHAEDDLTVIEADGAIAKSCDNVVVSVAAHCSEISRRTDDHVDVIAPDGVLSRRL